MNITELSLIGFVGLLLILFVIVFARYLIVSGAYHILVVRLFGRRHVHRLVDHVRADKKQILTEIGWSALSAVIFAATGIGLFFLWNAGLTAIYTEPTAWSVWYIPLSVLLALLIQDTYYYWIHRWMHRPSVYKYVHKVHHNSIHTSVFTSFSFHPIETVLQALIVPVIVLVLPMHIYAVLAVLVIMTISATINHAAVEVYPAGWERHWLTKWIIGSTHHDQHHKSFRTNYGLYFTIWDKLMGTESEKYDQKFREVVSGE